MKNLAIPELIALLSGCATCAGGIAGVEQRNPHRGGFCEATLQVTGDFGFEGVGHFNHWLGALLASLAPPLCLLVVMFFSRTGDPTFADMLRTGSVVFLVAFPVSLVAMLAIGLPFVLWLRSRNALNTLLVCIGAVVIGAITFGLLAWLLTAGIIG